MFGEGSFSLEKYIKTVSFTDISTTIFKAACSLSRSIPIPSCVMTFWKSLITCLLAPQQQVISSYMDMVMEAMNNKTKKLLFAAFIETIKHIEWITAGLRLSLNTIPGGVEDCAVLLDRIIPGVQVLVIIRRMVLKGSGSWLQCSQC